MYSMSVKHKFRNTEKLISLHDAAKFSYPTIKKCKTVIKVQPLQLCCCNSRQVTHPVLGAPWVICWGQEYGRILHHCPLPQDCGCPGRSRSRTLRSPIPGFRALKETPEETANTKSYHQALFQTLMQHQEVQPSSNDSHSPCP